VSFARSDTFRPYATLTVILGSALLLLIQKATGNPLSTYGGLIVPIGDEWWRYLTAPFAYVDVGYLFVVAVGLAIFGTGVERRLGSAPTALLLLACGSLGVLAAGGIAGAGDDITVIAGGNGMALGAVTAWFAIRRAESHGRIDEELDVIGVAVAAAVLIALPLFAPTANFFACLVGGAVGALAGVAATTLHHKE
jgi:membrane associated rhomboid family serine protease